MDNLRSAIEILFLKQDPDFLLREHCISRNQVNGVDKDSFIKKLLISHKEFTGDQAKQLYSLLKETWMNNGRQTLSVFQVLATFGRDVLRVKNNMPICQYEHYLRWHEMSAAIGEDILTCSFLAADDMKTRTKRKSFAWNIVLESDNTHLEALFNRGLSELHCHLKGSSINFDLNWLAIMNEPKYQKREWFAKASNHCSPLYEYAIIAAFIRMHLFLHIEGYAISNKFDKMFLKIWSSPNKQQRLLMYIDHLQSEICTQLSLHAYHFKKRVVDYAIPKDLSVSDSKATAKCLLVGERKLMYECFRRIFGKDETIANLEFWFYLYLVIKLQIKELIIQHNNVKGFANFKIFDKNKEIFIEHSRNKVFQTLVQELAIESYQQNKHINYYELRIAPKDTASAMRAKLNELSACLGNKGKPKCVFHFIKRPDQEHCFNDWFENSYYCRNYYGRMTFKRQSLALELLMRGTEDRVVGIDAANSEFGCRPEVFAEIYRRLQHLRRDTSLETFSEIPWHDLGITYHVGEDYYDVVDGLRAIEEAILFLNMIDGARLGHAVALGIDSHVYYRERKNKIIIPKQDLLDNCVWLLAKMDEYAIPDQAGIRNHLLYEVQRLMNDIYPQIEIKDYRLYYQSWLLRGDEPSLYRTTSNVPTDSIVEPYLLNHFEEKINVARMQEYARKLYCDYHYDAGAKHRGHNPEEWQLPEMLVDVIDAIQIQMRNDVARRKIAIEVNPTSNLRICNLETYDTHPVVKFYNYGLSVMDDYNDCPQISVSINTDDKGIFATSLEKEYTLMSLALEKQKTTDGRQKFQPNNILNWLEGIRQEAEIQRFG